MRGAFGLDPSRRKTDIPMPQSVKEVDREKLRLAELINALATVAIDQNTDVQRDASSLGSLRGKLSAPPPVIAPQGGYEVYDAYFQQMLTSNLWMPHGVAKKRNELFCPVVRFHGSLEEVYLYNNETGEPVRREIPARKALRQHAKSDSRWLNISILREFYASQVNMKNKARCRKGDAIANTEERMSRRPLSQDAYIRELTKLLQHTATLCETAEGNV